MQPVSGTVALMLPLLPSLGNYILVDGIPIPSGVHMETHCARAAICARARVLEHTIFFVLEHKQTINLFKTTINVIYKISLQLLVILIITQPSLSDELIQQLISHVLCPLRQPWISPTNRVDTRSDVAEHLSRGSHTWSVSSPIQNSLETTNIMANNIVTVVDVTRRRLSG